MKIFEVKICNYRQYRGENVVNLSIDPKRNFTIIQGDNGGGKSNFMNAIIWCLYGDEMFKSKNEGRSIANELALQEANVGDKVETYVEIKMGETEPKYIVTRKVVFLKYSSGIGEESKDFKIKEKSPKAGLITITYPDWFIETHFIPKDLRGFFFFDGEKMDEYFEDTSKVKANVQKIAQIDVLQNSIETLNGTISDINSDIKKITPASSDTLDQLEAKKREKVKCEEELKKVNDDIYEYGKKIKEIDLFLKNNSDTVVSEIQKNRTVLENQRKEKVNLQAANERNIASFISQRAPILLAIQALTNSERIIEEETQKGVLPPNIKDVFLQDLLDKGVCICGRDLSKGSECYNHVETLLHQLMPSDISEDATHGRYCIGEMLKKKDFIGEYREYLEKRMKFDEEISDLTTDINALSDKLSKYNVVEIRQKEEERQKYDTSLRRAYTRSGTLGNKIVTLEKEIQYLDEELARISVNYKNIQYLEKQRAFAELLRSTFREIKESILDDVRKQLEEKTRSYFFSMIWKKGAFSDVKIKDMGAQYHISVLSEYGNECLGDLSAGERQVLALSFTAALYSVSGYSVPVIIDTPLGRISGTPRDNIASALPNYLSETQVMMLATDTEYTETVRNKLKCSVGAEFKIKHDEETKTSKVIDFE